MKYIIAGTHRPGSRTLQVAQFVKGLYLSTGEPVEIIDLAQLTVHELDGSFYGASLPEKVHEAVEKISHSEGLHFVVPEYNGSMPGALKLFIDHWKFPESFEFRPVCFTGLGGLFGGLRPVEHLQQVMAYRNAYQYPLRVFLMNVWNNFKNGEVLDPVALSLMKDQVVGFQKFCKALQGAQLDANSVNAHRAAKK